MYPSAGPIGSTSKMYPKPIASVHSVARSPPSLTWIAVTASYPVSGSLLPSSSLFSSHKPEGVPHPGTSAHHASPMASLRLYGDIPAPCCTAQMPPSPGPASSSPPCTGHTYFRAVHPLRTFCCPFHTFILRFWHD